MEIIPDNSIRRGSSAFKLRSKRANNNALCGSALLLSPSTCLCIFPRKSASGGDHYHSSGVEGGIVSRLQAKHHAVALCVWGRTPVCFCSFQSLMCSAQDIYRQLLSFSSVCFIACLDGGAVKCCRNHFTVLYTHV